MNPWSEHQIGIIYFTGLMVTLASGILILVYLQPANKALSKISAKFHSLWNFSFKTTLLFAGLLGAFSVTFKDCSGRYDALLESRYKTAMKGFEMVSSSFDYFALALGFWLIIFIMLRIRQNRSAKS
jgi:hypothetical protein